MTVYDRRGSIFSFVSTRFRSTLITQHVFDGQTPENRKKVAEQSPIGRALILRPAEYLSQYIPDGVPDAVKPEWSLRDYNGLLRSVIEAALTHGCCAVQLFDGTNGQYWRVLYPPWITSAYYTEDGTIGAIRVAYVIPMADTPIAVLNPQTDVGGIEISERSLTSEKLSVEKNLVIGENCLWVEFQHTISGTGRSYLKSVWDQVAYLALIEHNMAQYDAKGGSGFFIVSTTQALDDQDYLALENQLGELDSKMGAIMPPNATGDIVGNAGKAIDFPAHMTELRKDIAAATGFPMTFLDGTQMGSLGSHDNETDNQVLFVLRSMFTQFVPFIRQLVKVALGAECDQEIYPVVGGAEDETEYQDEVVDPNQTVDPQKVTRNLQ